MVRIEINRPVAPVDRQDSLASPVVRRLRTINAERANNPIPPRLKPRGIPPALLDHEIYVTRSVSIAEQAGREMLGAIHLDVNSDESADFLASLHAVRFRDITMGYLEYVAATTMYVEQLPPDYLVMMPMNGGSHIHNGRNQAEATSITAVSPHPGTAMRMAWNSHSPHLVIRITRDSLDLHLSRLLGRSLDHPLMFDLALDMSPDSANRWNSAIQLLHTELFHDDSLLHQGVGTGPLEEFVMSALLFAHRSNYSVSLARPEHAPGRRAIRTAQDYIETHLSEPLTMHHIADAAQVSIRSLQDGFHNELRTTPTAFVRDRRLERVRNDLAEAGPNDGTTVSEVAFRWGFNHLGRFASSYRQRFGESPSQTLRN